MRGLASVVLAGLPAPRLTSSSILLSRWLCLTTPTFNGLLISPSSCKRLLPESPMWSRMSLLEYRLGTVARSCKCAHHSLHALELMGSTCSPTARTDVDEMGGLDELISDVAALLKSTTKSLTRTLRAVARRRNEFVNINSLPEEILRPIFLDATGDNMYHKFSIADTCVPWRNICIAFPGFWTDFEVPHDYDVASRAFTIAEQAGLPLRLKVDWKSTPYKVIQLVDTRGKLVEHLEITEFIPVPIQSAHLYIPITAQASRRSTVFGLDT